jgi:S-adenosylmethionine synthetase
LAERFEIQLSYAIGVAHPVSIMVETFGTGYVGDETIRSLIEEHFDLRPAAIIETLGCGGDLSADGDVRAFRAGRPGLPWERTDKAPALAMAAGVPAAEAVGTD